jgi:hypothetical protein
MVLRMHANGQPRMRVRSQVEQMWRELRFIDVAGVRVVFAWIRRAMMSEGGTGTKNGDRSNADRCALELDTCPLRLWEEDLEWRRI